MSLIHARSLSVFCGLHIGEQVTAPQLQDFRQDLVDGEHLELIQCYSAFYLLPKSFYSRQIQ